MKKFLIENTKNKIPKSKSPLQTGEQMSPADTMGAKNSQFTTKKTVDNFHPNVKTEDTKIAPEVTSENIIIPQTSNNRTFYKAEESTYLDALSNMTLASNSNTEAILDETSNSLTTNFNENPANIIEFSTEDYLNTLHSVSRLPSSPVKPTHMRDRAYLDYCLLAIMKDCENIGIPAEEYVPLGQLMRGNPGSNITMIASLAPDVEMFKGYVNFSPHVSPEHLETLPRQYRNQLREISVKKSSMIPYEVKAAENINKDFEEDRVVMTQEYDYRGHDWYYNNTPNDHPDFAIIIAKPTSSNIKLVAQDLKISHAGAHSSKDIIRMGTDDLKLSTTKAQKTLADHLEELIQSNTLTTQDLKLVTAFQKDLQLNMASSNIEDLATWVSAYNKLNETHREIICKLNIGMQLQTQVSIDDMNVSQLSKEFFVERFKYHFTSSESEVQSYLNDKIYDDNTTVAEHYNNLRAFAQMLEDAD